MLDELSEYYADLLDGTYDCVDRIVLNGYFRLGQSPGGFRTWWRNLEGSDDNLDTAHLMRMAGRFSRRVRAHAKAHQIPLIDCAQGERKHELAKQHLPQDPNFVGVFLILVGRAPAPVWDVVRSKGGTLINIARKTPAPYVNHYSFHIIDPDWGHITIKLCGHPHARQAKASKDWAAASSICRQVLKRERRLSLSAKRCQQRINFARAFCKSDELSRV